MKKFFLFIVIIVFVLPVVTSCVGRCRDCAKIVKVTTLDGVHFDFDKALLKPEGKTILDRDLALLKENKKLSVSIEGHCDVLGSDEYNQQLSERRAKTVYDYLLAQNIQIDRMTTVGWGRKKPIAPNDNSSNRAKNRRVELVIVKAK